MNHYLSRFLQHYFLGYCGTTAYMNIHINICSYKFMYAPTHVESLTSHPCQTHPFPQMHSMHTQNPPRMFDTGKRKPLCRHTCKDPRFRTACQNFPAHTLVYISASLQTIPMLSHTCTCAHMHIHIKTQTHKPL